MRSHLLALLIITLVGLFAVKELFVPGLFTAHDIWHQVARFYHYTEALKDGQLLPSWISTLADGYGYPLFIFSYHLPWILGAPLVLLGMDLFVALKVVFGVGFLAAGWSMYGLSHYLTKKPWTAVVAAMIYLWSPFHFLSLFVSASIGNVMAFALLPLLVWGLFLSLKDKKWSGMVMIALSVCGLILTHLITLVLVLPFAVLLVGLNWLLDRKGERLTLAKFAELGRPALALFLGLWLSAFYLIPLVKYLPLINAVDSGRGFKDLYKVNLVQFKQLLYSPWGFGPIIEHARNGEISLQVGIAQWLAVGLAVLTIGWLVLKRKSVSSLILTTVGLFGLSVFLMIEQAEPVWKFASEFITVDYPFRLLLVAVFMGSLLAGLVLAQLKNKVVTVVLGSLLILASIYTNRNHIRVNLHTDVPLQLYIDSETTTNTFNEYLPLGTNLPKDTPKDQVAFTTSKVTDIHQNTRQLSFTLELAAADTVSFRQFAFPGVKVYLNGQPQTHKVDPKGYVSLDLPAGVHQILIRFEPEPLMQLSGFASFLAIVFIAYQTWRPWK